MTEKRLFIVTGDPSGDFHAANVVRYLKEVAPDVDIAAVGGKQLQEAGAELLADQERMGRVGFGSVLGAPYHYGLGRRILSFLETFRPTGILLIDYGVFNLWLAARIKKRFPDSPIYYFIPPQVWASRKGRIKKIKKSVDHVFCIFPFEEPLYQEHGIPVTFVGHPLVGQLPPPVSKEDFMGRHGLSPKKRLIGLFPGSRKMEIDYLLEPMLGAAYRLQREFFDLQFVLARASSLRDDYFQKRLEKARAPYKELNLAVVEGDNHALLSAAEFALAASGTVTLEAALYGTPVILMYAGHPVAYQIFRRACYLPCIGLPNILTDMKNPIVPELWQNDVNPETIVRTAKPFLEVTSAQTQHAMQGFRRIQASLGSENAPEAVARQLAEWL